MRGLKFKVIMMCVGMLILFSGITSMLYVQSINGQKKAKLGAFEAAAIAMQNSITAQFYERYGDVQAFGRNTVFHGKDVKAMEQTLNGFASDYGIYDIILFVDLKGNYVASNSTSPGGKELNLSEVKAKNYSNETWFRSVVDGKTTDEQGGLKGTYFEGPFIDHIVKSAYSNDGYGTVFSALVKDINGKPIGVMSNRANWSWVEYDILSRGKVLSDEGYKQVEINLINKDGIVISSFDPDSAAKEGELRRDFEKILLKQNLVSAGDEAAKKSLVGHRGAEIFNNPMTMKSTIYGFAPVSGKKWVSSIGWGVTIKSDTAAVFADIDQAKNLFFIIAGIVLIACSTAGLFFARKLSGDLTVIAKGITESGATVNSASTELAGASQQVSSGATQAASSLEETVASLEELTAMVKLNSENAAQAAALAKGSSKVAADGETEVKNLISSITEVAQSSQKIEDIINVIDDIAFQTNLLALNAAVEAARAGEQGKGFAVVADAVRNLAQRSATAAKEITTLIKENVSKIEHSTKQADRSGVVLKEILTSVTKVADISNEIAAASQEQSSGLSQISKAMNELDQATQRNAATSEEVAAASDQMSQEAQVLSQVVGSLNNIIFGVDHAYESISSAHVNQRPVESRKSNKRSQVITTHKPQSKKVVTFAKGKKPEQVIPFDEDKDPNKLDNVQGF